MSAFSKKGKALDKRVLQMSHKEIDRVGVIKLVESKKLSQKVGAKQLFISARQMRRLQKRFHQHGNLGLISSKRGRPSNNQLPEQVQLEIVALIKANYADFGPTLAQEKLVENHQLTPCVETVRAIMIKHHIWEAKPVKTKRVFQLRPRRRRFGELIQIDGSPHDWFEGRSAKCTLIVFIDDATGKLTGLHFTPTETTQAYMHVLKAHMNAHGRPVGLYSDRHGIFRVNHKEAILGNGYTQFSRSLSTLDIGSIQAQTPQAKGRVERANKTLQDRLVKEMRLKGINTLEEGNAFLPAFMRLFNTRFARPPQCEQNAHRPVLHSEREIDLILTKQEKRKISNQLEVSYEKTVHQITGNRHRLKQKQITICVLFGDGIVMLYEGKEIKYQVFTDQARLSKLEDEKTLNTRIDNAIKQQAKSSYKAPADHP